MPKFVDHQAYRLQLLEQATPLFLECGYEGLTTRELAKSLEISTGTLYHYFSSKEGFFAALARHWMQQDMSWVRASFEHIPERQERIRQVALLLLEHRQKFDTQNRIVLEFCRMQQQRGQDLRPFWLEIYQSWEQLTREVLQLRSQFAVDLVCQSIDGFFMQWLQGSQSTDIVAYFERLSHWLPLIDASAND